jgi:AmmeMemoRadiSam system protein B
MNKFNKQFSFKLNKMEENVSYVRKASHAGSWYSNNKNNLISDIQSFLSKAERFENSGIIKSLIVPHAGYRWSGPTAGWGYLNIDPNLYKRVVLLGPSHHALILGCGLTPCKYFDTPLGQIEIDIEEVERLSKIKGFEIISCKVDEAEHSLEMQLPFLRYIFSKDGTKIDFKLIPIMVGLTNLEYDKYFAKIFVDYYKDPETLFIISSDFCHWGSRFKFTYHDVNNTHIYESIEYLDKLGMAHIESISSENFDKYLKEYKNTICGRRPISILLSTIEEYFKNTSKNNSIIKFTKYDLSDKVTSSNGSSVSYSVAVNYITN